MSFLPTVDADITPLKQTIDTDVNALFIGQEHDDSDNDNDDDDADDK